MISRKLSVLVIPKFLKHRFFNLLESVCLALLLLPFSIHQAVADESVEYGVKAAFLYKFGSYVEWPSTAFAASNSPLNVCLVGSAESFISTLEKVVSTENINGRSVTVRPVKTVPKDNSCHIVYIDQSENTHAAEIAESVRGYNILTVSNDGSSGIIDFVIANNRVRFNIDDEAAAQNGLLISSKLLSVALKVKKRVSKGA